VVRPDSFDLAYLDSNVFIRYVRRGSSWQVVDRIIRAAEANQFDLMISPLLLVECLGQQPGPAYDVGSEARALALLDNPRLSPVEFNRSIAIKARHLLLDGTVTGGVCDAIHLASAIEHEADVFLTFDTDDFPIGRRIGGLWVDEPFFPGDGTDLFSSNDD
jgi:predicted nucleic acid-binding protein